MIRRAIRPTYLTVVSGGLALAAITGTAGYLLGRYPYLSVLLPVHFNRYGFPDRWQRKSLAVVLAPVWIQAALALVFGAVVFLLLWRAAPVRGEPEADGDRRRMLAAAEAVALLAAIWIAFQGLGAMQLVGLWERGWGGLGSSYAIGIVLAVVASIIVGARAVVLVGRTARAAVAEQDRFWRFKALYVNPANPSLFVPARRGVGWTLNFGRPAAVLVMVLVLLLGFGAPFLILRSLLR